MPMINYNKLLGKIKECRFTQERLAESIGVKPTTLSLKLNNKSHFSDREIRKICSTLGIEATEIGEYFFTPISSEISK